MDLFDKNDKRIKLHAKVFNHDSKKSFEVTPYILSSLENSHFVDGVIRDDSGLKYSHLEVTVDEVNSEVEKLVFLMKDEGKKFQLGDEEWGDNDWFVWFNPNANRIENQDGEAEDIQEYSSDWFEVDYHQDGNLIIVQAKNGRFNNGN
jgi:hypothetical protein